MPKVKSDDGLSVKERLFVENYVRCLNATKAALAAGYSAKTAAVIGYENLIKPHIKTKITELLEAKSLSVEEVVSRLSDHARGSMELFLDESAELSLESEKAKENYHLIKKLKKRRYTSVEGAETVTVEIELYDAQSALRTILEAKGGIIQRIQQVGSGAIELWVII